MKKNLTFIPLGIGISSAIIYLFNVFRFRIINNSVTLLQILNNLRIYLYISIGGFLFYFLIKILSSVNNKNSVIKESVIYSNPKPLYENKTDTINENIYPGQNSYIPNYDYVPLYGKNKYEKKEVEESKKIEPIKQEPRNIFEDNKGINIDTSYCNNCGQIISSNDLFCKRCGFIQKNNYKRKNSLFRKLINILEIVILILILYFLINMLFDYKEKNDPNFRSPLKINVTK